MRSFSSDQAEIDAEIFDLLVGDHQLGGEILTVDLLSGFAQHVERAGKVGRIERNLAHPVPPGEGPVEQADALE